jgi:hypothetical protein
MATAAEMLTNVETAINDLVVNGLSEVTVEGRTFRMNNLEALMKWRNTLRAEVASSPSSASSSTSGGGRVRHMSFENFR